MKKTLSSNPAPSSLTIGRLANAAQVNIETVRYYQNRGLIPVPAAKGAFRHYPIETVERIRFIKRSQELGFTLNEISELLLLDKSRDRKIIRTLANNKLAQIEQKLTDLIQLQKTLKHLVKQCHSTSSHQPCPIITSLSTK